MQLPGHVWKLVSVMLGLYYVVHVVYWGVTPSVFRWLCNFAVPFVVYALWSRDESLSAALFLLLLVPHTLWFFDAVSVLRGAESFGMLTYLETASVWGWLLSLHHVFVVPLLYVSGMRFRYGSVWAALGVWLLASVLTVAVTDANLNCVYAPCEVTYLSSFFEGYMTGWYRFLAAVFVAVLLHVEYAVWRFVVLVQKR